MPAIGQKLETFARHMGKWNLRPCLPSLKYLAANVLLEDAAFRKAKALGEDGYGGQDVSWKVAKIYQPDRSERRKIGADLKELDWIPPLDLYDHRVDIMHALNVHANVMVNAEPAYAEIFLFAPYRCLLLEIYEYAARNKAYMPPPFGAGPAIVDAEHQHIAFLAFTKFGDAYIDRLKTDPGTKKYLKNLWNKPDNTYQEFESTDCAICQQIKELLTDNALYYLVRYDPVQLMTNVLHQVYWFFQQVRTGKDLILTHIPEKDRPPSMSTSPYATHRFQNRLQYHI